MNEAEFQNVKEVVKDELGLDLSVSYQKMENGEKRIRFTGNGTSNPFSHIAVVMDRYVKAAWQNAHYHLVTVETWIVEKGCQIIIEQTSDGYKIIVMRKGDVYTSTIGIAHNCYVFPDTITHTIKTTVGNSTFDNDWKKAEKLDEYSKSINMENIIKKYNLEQFL